VELGSLTLKEEHMMKVFENRVLRKMFGPATDEVVGQWTGFMVSSPHQYYLDDHIKRNENRQDM
jgi:hypothetical protein